MTNRTIIIGSRGSDLALWQANFFQDRMRELGHKTEIKVIKTKGDKVQDLSFEKMEGKGFFTKEIEHALHNAEIDVAIHSHKDLETSPVPGLVIAGVSKREDPSELLLIRKEKVNPRMMMRFQKGAVLGTSSARRKAQITDFRPDVTIKDIRGNVPTRVQKLRNGDFDAILLAFAGVHRLGLDLSDLHVEKLDPAMFIPAPAQGVLAYQCREEDQHMIDIIQELNDPETKVQIDIERNVLNTFGGGCQVPLGAFARPKINGYEVRVSHATDWEPVSHRVVFHTSNPQKARETFSELKTAKVAGPVLITKRLADGALLRRAAKEQGFELIEQPFIEIVQVAFDSPDLSKFDWIFFSSANAVRFFLSRATLPRDMKIGVMGEGTAHALSMLGHSAHYKGESSDPDDVAMHFAKEVGKDAKVIFPQSSISRQTVMNTLNKDQVESVVVYDTKKSEAPIEMKPESIVFTSPSNVSAFAEAGNRIASSARIVAIGPRTATALKSLGYSPETAEFPIGTEIYSLLARRN